MQVKFLSKRTCDMTTTPPLFSGLDGLMTLSRREGVDIRPTLLRVLTDLYVQTTSHTADEERQFIELTSRLIDEVDDATRAVVRARLSIYSQLPPLIADKLGLQPKNPDRPASLARSIEPQQPAISSEIKTAASPASPTLSMLPNDAAQISEMFFAANSSERAAILFNLAGTPLKASPRIPAARAARAIHILEMAAFAVDPENFMLELGEALILPARMAAQVVNDPGGEPLACALKALNMSSEAFQRVLLFLNPEVGASVTTVYRLSRLYDQLSERSVLILLAAWRGAAMPIARSKHQPLLHDDERHRARAGVPLARPDAHHAGSEVAARHGTRRAFED
jgi:hypothetical protein